MLINNKQNYHMLISVFNKYASKNLKWNRLPKSNAINYDNKIKHIKKNTDYIASTYDWLFVFCIFFIKFQLKNKNKIIKEGFQNDDNKILNEIINELNLKTQRKNYSKDVREFYIGTKIRNKKYSLKDPHLNFLLRIHTQYSSLGSKNNWKKLLENQLNFNSFLKFLVHCENLFLIKEFAKFVNFEPNLKKITNMIKFS